MSLPGAVFSQSLQLLMNVFQHIFGDYDEISFGNRTKQPRVNDIEPPFELGVCVFMCYMSKLNGRWKYVFELPFLRGLCCMLRGLWVLRCSSLN